MNDLPRDLESMAAKCRELFPSLEQERRHFLRAEGPGAQLSLFLERGAWRFNLIVKNHWGFLTEHPYTRESWWYQYPVSGADKHDGSLINVQCLALLLLVASGDCPCIASPGLDQLLAELAAPEPTANSGQISLFGGVP